MSAHTPGPLHVDAGCTVRDADGRITADCDTAVMGNAGTNIDSPAECMSNAVLYAAAPELLGALRAVADETLCYESSPRPYSGDSYLPEKFKDLIRAALAAAEGTKE